MITNLRALPVCALLAAPALSQTTTQVALSYNFNGIVHAGEAGVPDDLNGYRSISDRGLDFGAGVPADPLLAPYSLVSTPGALDIVHLGNRNTVSGGLWMFDAVVDGDDVGVQPAWLANPDQTGPQTTTLGTPVLLEATSRVTLLYQISNGGGTFDVRCDLMSGGSVTVTLSGGDWFGGAFLGTDAVDRANPGANLSITEGTVDLSAHAGDSLTAITFSNASNSTAGYAILAANVFTDPTVITTLQIPLNYNFNGIVHIGEAGTPDDLNGYRSISDRGLDFNSGVPSDLLLDPYSLVGAPGMLDIVHLGNRNTVDNGNWMFDTVVDGDDIGIQPGWLANVDQTGPQTTTLAAPIQLANVSRASFLYQISNGGGAFDVIFAFQSGATFTATLSGGDWFGGAYLGTEGVDSGTPDNNLSITEGNVALGAFAGDALVAFSFANRSNPIAGYAILAANVTGSGDVGSSYCGPAIPNSTGFPGTISGTGSPVAAANDLTLNAEGLPPGQFGYFLAGRMQGFFNPPNSQGIICLSGNIGRFNQVANIIQGPSGSIPVDLTAVPVNPTQPVSAGETWHFQCWYRDVNPGGTSNFTDGLLIVFQ